MCKFAGVDEVYADVQDGFDKKYIQDNENIQSIFKERLDAIALLLGSPELVMIFKTLIRYQVYWGDREREEACVGPE